MALGLQMGLAGDGGGYAISAPPVHWWQMDAEPYVDSVGDWDLTESGTVDLTAGAAPDGIASAPLFNAVGDFLSITGRSWAYSQYSVGGFYKLNAITSTVGNYLCNLRSATVSAFSIAARNDSPDYLNALAWDDAQTASAVNVNSVGVTTGVWYHILMTVDMVADEVKLYLNGALIGTSTTALTTGEVDALPLYFGSSAAGGGASNVQHLGYLSQWGLWDTVLTQRDAEFLYNG